MLMPIGEPFVILSSVDSTNKYAMQEVHDQLSSHGKAYFAFEQTQGRGQRGKSWQSAPGENLILSVVLQIEQPFPKNPFLFSAAMALGCYDFFSKYAGEETSLKWPNDLYWRDRKAGGLLIENSLNAGFWKASVVGFGININQTKFDPSLSNPVSLRQITGKTFDPVLLAKELCSALAKRWEQWNKEPTKLLEQYNAVLYKKNQHHTFQTPEGPMEGTVQYVDEQGKLIVLCPDQKAFEFGSLQWN